MALAPVAFVLWDRYLRHNPANPNWPNRDRFILSNGHASMLLYSLLYLTGYGLTLGIHTRIDETIAHVISRAQVMPLRSSSRFRDSGASW